MNYTAEQRAALLQQARETLARASQIEPLDIETLARQHKANASAPAQPASESKLTDAESHQLRIEFANMVATAIAAEHSYLLENLLPDYLALLIKDIRTEIADAVGGLRAEMNVSRAIDKEIVIKRRRARKSTVVDLPNPLLRKVSG